MDSDIRKLLIELVDVVRDVNYTISMHIDNPNSEYIDKASHRVMRKISKDLQRFTDTLSVEQAKEKPNAEITS